MLLIFVACAINFIIKTSECSSKYLNFVLDKNNSSDIVLKQIDYSRGNKSFFQTNDSENSNNFLISNLSVANLIASNRSCDKYNYNKYFITNCSLIVSMSSSDEKLLLNIFTVGVKNSNNSLNLDYFIQQQEMNNTEDDFFNVYPRILQNKFIFETCNSSNCENWGQENISYFNEFKFKLSASDPSLNKFELNLQNAILLVKDYYPLYERLFYYSDVTSLVRKNNNYTSLALDRLPDIFDLQLIYKVRPREIFNFTTEDVRVFNF